MGTEAIDGTKKANTVSGLDSRVMVCVKDGNQTFCLESGESLMEGLIREGFYVSAVCGGKGRCGKCKVRVLEGDVPASSEDGNFFTDTELEAGWRLSCLVYPTQDIAISFDWNDESQFEAVSEFGKTSVPGIAERDQHGTELAGTTNCYISIDIGTTTIAMQLLDDTGVVRGSQTAINSQRRFGADVISRIQASVDGKGELLRESIRKDLQEGIYSLLQDCKVDLEQIKKVAIACNTTMSHLLLGYDCESLGLYPFTPVNIDFIRGSVREIIGLPSKAEVVVLPGISTYVGGDIVSGMYACDMQQTDEVCLLVDLGTNGEMALGNCRKILVTSTAAGPAFEGGNLSCGMGSVAGAICSVKLEEQNGNWICTVGTIQDRHPIGICGTGAIEALAELLEAELIDETGLLDEEYFDEGFSLADTEQGEAISLTQKDIRELQLAKAAVRAGIETLLVRYGVTKEQVKKVYLAGGFGYRLDVEKAIAIGMLPEEFKGKVTAVGNSSLAGANRFLSDIQTESILQSIVDVSEEISLSTDKDFNEFYMEYMMFE